MNPVIPGQPLFVAALAAEAAHLPSELPILITGVGKIRATAELTRTLAEAAHLPSEIINIGTAGAISPFQTGVFDVAQVIQHDFPESRILDATLKSYGGPIRLRSRGVTLATGDSFIETTAARDRLAALGANLCDMEGYAIAYVAQTFGLPVRLLKAVSDPADESAQSSWEESLDRCAQQLATRVAQILS